MAPILHLSIPVTDLPTSVTFYVEALGCAVGRQRPGWADVWFQGLQLTLQERPDEVARQVVPTVRHFGATLEHDELARMIEHLSAYGVDWLHGPSTDHAGTPREQHKAKLADPSGNVIELKSYRDLAAAFELDQPTAP
jgi:extradiol dioxygenase family protein